MFQPSDKFYTNIQLNSVIYESQGIVVHDVVDLDKRKKYALIERSTGDENEYADLQKDICAFDKSESPYIIKIHKYTYDLVIPESKHSMNRMEYGLQQNVFSKNGQQILNNQQNVAGMGGIELTSKKIYRLSFLTDYFTTNLKQWIERKREEIDKHNSQFKSNAMYSKGNIRKGLPQYEFCSLFHQMVEAINHVYQREQKRTVSPLKEYVCKVDILAENFVINESVDLENKIKFIPMNFLSIYNRNLRKKYTSLIENSEKYSLKKRQTIELQNELLHSITTPKRLSNANSINSGRTSIKAKTFSHILDSDFNTTKNSAVTTMHSLTNVISYAQSEETETKYLRMLFDLGLKLGSLYTGSDNFTEPNQPLSQLAKQVLSDVCKQYKNVSRMLLQLIDPTFISTSYISSPQNKRPNLKSICSDLKKINDQEYNQDENNFHIPKFHDDFFNDEDQWAEELKMLSPTKSHLGGLLQVIRQGSQKNESSGSLTSIPHFNDGSTTDQRQIKLFKQKSMNSQSGTTAHSSMKNTSSRRKSKKSTTENTHLELSPSSGASCQIEIYDIEYLYEKRPKKYKGLVFIPPYTNFLNVIHINEKKNSYLEKVEIKQADKVVIPYEHQIVLAPGVGEFKVYILGGEESNQVLEIDSISDGKVTKKANMLAGIERRQFGTCMIERDSQILVATGIKDQQITSQCEIYDIAQNKWSKICDANIPLIGSSLCLYNKSSVYKFGGVDGNGKITKMIEKYDIYQGTWKCVQYDIDANLQQNICFAKNMLSIQINHNQIMIFGGEFNPSNTNNAVIGSTNGVTAAKHIRHPFYSSTSTNSMPPSNLNKKIFFCHIDKLGHHELFGVDQYGALPDNSSYLLPGQVALTEGEVIFFQKQLVRADTGKMMGFSVENQVRDIRGTDIRF